MEQTPDVIDQVPAGGGVNTPASGTYGEKAELERLKQQLPSAEPVQPVPTSSQAGPVPIGRGRAPAVPSASGLPSGLTSPTRRPDVPALPNTPVGQDPYGGAVDARQRRLRVLDAIANSQEVSPETREWAEILVQKLAGNVAG